MVHSWKTPLIKFSVVALLALVLSAGSLLLFKPSQVQAASCYGGAVNSTFTEPGTKYPGDPAFYYYTREYKTTSRCRDVNFRLTYQAGYYEILYLRVCFYPSSGGFSCQSSFKEVNTNDRTWHVMATDVLDGTRFVLQRRSYNNHLGFRFQLAF